MRASAIITTFNRKNLLEKAARSVLRQTYRDFELIILDNSSTDGTEALVKNLADSRIVYVKHQSLGISAARNLGVTTARGEFVGFLDDDDEWLPKKLSLQVSLFERSSPKVGLVYGGFLRIRPTGEVYDSFTPNLRGSVLVGYLCGRNPLTGSASNPLMRREAVLAVGGYNNKLKTSEDWEFYLRLARQYDFDFVKEPVVKIRAHSGPRLGDRLEDAAETELVVLEEFADVFKDHPRCQSIYFQIAGGKYCRLGKSSMGRKYLRQAIARDTSNLAAYAQYAISFFGKGFYSFVHALYKKFNK